MTGGIALEAARSEGAPSWTRSGWVVTVGLTHLLPGILLLLVVSFFLFLGLLGSLGTWAFGKGDAAVGVAIIFGAAGLVPAFFALPFACVGIGVLRRRAWARLLAIYLATGLAGTGLLFLVAQRNAFGAFPLAHGALTLAVLLLPRFAAEFRPRA